VDKELQEMQILIIGLCDEKSGVMSAFNLGKKLRDYHQDSRFIHLIRSIIVLLEDDRPHVRSNAAFVFGECGYSDATKHMILLMKDKVEKVRRSAASALGKIGDSSTIPVLIKALKDKSSAVREDATGALRMIADPYAIPKLLEALEDMGQDHRSIVRVLVEFDEMSFEAVNKAYISGKITHEAAGEFYRLLEKKLNKENFDKGTVAPPKKPPGNPDEMERMLMRRMSGKTRPKTQDRKPKTLKRGATSG
jgi:hypothetical protein